MKKSTYLIFVFALFFIAASPTFARAENESPTALVNKKYKDIAEKMKELYDKGDLLSVIELYNKECTAGDRAKAGKEKREFKRVDKETRVNIYQWLVLSHIAMDITDEEDIYLRRLLAARRGKDAGDYWMPIRNAARNKYYTSPRLLIGFKGGANFSKVNPFKRFSVLRPAAGFGTDSYDKDYAGVFQSPGLQLGLIVEYALTKNLSVTFQPDLRGISFQYENNFTWKNENNVGETAARFTHTQKLNYVELPVLLKYRLVKWKLQPYIQLGGFYRIQESADRILRARLIPEIEGFNEEAAMDMRNQFTWGNGGIIAGLGVGYDTGGIRLEAELNYKFVFNNIVNGDRRYENKELVYNYYDVLDDIKVRNWDLSLKVLLPITFKAFRR